MRKKPGFFLELSDLLFSSFVRAGGANWQLLNKYDYADGWSVNQYYDS